MNKESHIALALALIYALFATAWIFLSDRFLFFRAPDTGILTELQTYKGIAFVVITAALFYFMIRQALQRQASTQKQLQESEERWKFALEGAGDGVWDWDPTTDQALFSNRWLEMLGYSAHEFPGKGSAWIAHLHPDDKEHVMAALQDCLQGKQPHYTSEFRMRCKDDSWKWILARGMVISRDADGKPVRMIGTHADITKRKLNETAVQSDKLKLEAALASMTDAVYISDLDGNFVDFNIAFATFHKFKSKAECPKALREFPRLIDVYSTSGEFVPLEDRPVSRALHGESSTGTEFILTRRDTGETWYGNYSYAPIRDTHGVIVGSVVTARDNTESKKTESELRIAAIAFETQEGVLITDAQPLILRVNNAFTRITGYSADEVIGKNPRVLSSGRHDADFYADIWKSLNHLGFWEGEIWNKRKNNEVYPEHLCITAVKNQQGIVKNYVATLTDITMSRDAAKTIQHLAFYDTLTSLPNRRLLLDRLKQALASSTRTGKEGALMFLDLDNFKMLNDTLGHDIGDLLLKQVARRIESSVREGDTVARLGGDEFVVMLEGLSDQTPEAARQTECVGAKILAALNQPYQLASHEYRCTTSIGATLFRNHHIAMDALFKQADIAMYQAKNAGRNTLRFFDIEM
jgi:diguanylate cyclase (GGDEF)-like protein/PAS domain S-box-containing protein